VTDDPAELVRRALLAINQHDEDLFLESLDPELLVEDAAAVTVMLLMLGSLWSALDALR